MAIIGYLLLRVKKHKNKISQAKQNVEDNFYSDIKEDYEPGLYDQYEVIDYAYASYEHGKVKDEKEEKHYLDLYDDSVDKQRENLSNC